jgi:ribosomal protein S27E
MPDGLEEIEMPVRCPACGNNTLRSVRWLKAHLQLDCETCQETIRLDERGSRDAILDAEKSIARIRRRFLDPS